MLINAMQRNTQATMHHEKVEVSLTFAVCGVVLGSTPVHINEFLHSNTGVGLGPEAKPPLVSLEPEG